eukprot:7320572-Lingulodinium_polyedra.AAC.1
MDPSAPVGSASQRAAGTQPARWAAPADESRAARSRHAAPTTAAAGVPLLVPDGMRHARPGLRLSL